MNQSNNRNLSMVMDLYELTMANGYFNDGDKETRVAFDVFYRRNPDKGGFAIFAGLEQIVEYIENLHFTKEDMETSKKIDPYIRVLGANTKGQALLSEICKTNKKLPVVTSVKTFTTTCRNKKLLMMLEKDIQATNIYTLGYEYDSYSNLDYTTKMITY